MDNLICKLCEEKFEETKFLHFHIVRKHKITIEKYYLDNYPKFDLFTHEKIKFKNYNFYFSTLFNNRKNLVDYFKKNNKDIDNLVKCIKLRADLKNLIDAPDTISARTSILPTPILCDFIKQDYNQICIKAGLKSKFNYAQKLDFNNVKLDIIQDTREQDGLDLKGVNLIISKLEYGDYVCKNLYKKVYCERKSLNDLIGSISGGYDRLVSEFERAQEAGAYLVILIEANLLDLLSFLPPEGSKQKATSDFICSRIRSLINKFNNIQFVFAKNRDESAIFLKKMFLMKNDIKTVDLQYFVDKGEF